MHTHTVLHVSRHCYSPDVHAYVSMCGYVCICVCVRRVTNNDVLGTCTHTRFTMFPAIVTLPMYMYMCGYVGMCVYVYVCVN